VNSIHTVPLTTPVTPNVVAEAVIDLDAIANNIHVLRDHAGSAAVMAVVKADGYGHGATPVSRAVLAAGATELGVATIAEALALRGDGITAPILAWLHPPGADFAPALRADVQLAVSSVRQLSQVLDAAVRTGVTAAVTVKIDTGLNRNGVSAADYPAMLDALLRAQSDEALRVRGLMSHMVYADDPDHPTNNLQAQRFSDMLGQARSSGVRYEVAHISNSSSAMSRPDLAYDMIRPGIAVYGLSPIPERGQMGLVPAMTLRCPVALVKPVRAGDGVSYGHIWVADRDTTLALMPIGYADGVYRGLSGRFDVLINGRRRPNVGRVCMDQFVVDLGPGETGVREGDTAVLFGPGTDGEPTAQDWAEALDTIHYEVVTSPRGRVTRVYRKGGTIE
jgi:alanine racemase